MKLILVAVVVFLTTTLTAQELFAITEPASNRPARSISFRLDHSLMDEIGKSKINYHLIPGIMVGVSKKLMVAGNSFFSNRTEHFKFEGGRFYAKYRFFSNDVVQKHFRMAAFASLSSNNSDVHQEEIDINGHNTGFGIGIAATKLLRKVALSGTLTYIKANDNGNNNKFVYGMANSKAVNYTFSIGKLMLPEEYRNYKQTNLNLMLEFQSQMNLGSGRCYMEIAPSVQLILRSRSRIDLGYKKELQSTLLRTAPDGFFIRLEYNLFNAF